jgi:hypothetical protein
MEELEKAKKELKKETEQTSVDFNVVNSEIRKRTNNRTLLILAALGTLFVSAVIIFSLVVLFQDTTASKPVAREKTQDEATPTSTPFAVSNINGLRVLPGLEKRHPIGVMIENHTDARPQFGLSKADLVYESPTEGNITRMLAIYQTQDVKILGPVRSARTYFVDWCEDYNCLYAHCGGNEDAWTKINVDKILDLNEFFLAPYFWRDYQNYFAPHNLFTSSEKLYQAAKDLGYPLDGYEVAGWEFKDEEVNQANENDKQKTGFKEPFIGARLFASTATPTQTATPEPRKQIVRINYSSNPYYSFYFEYDSQNNVYKRFDATGQAQTDALDGSQVAPKNLVVMTVNRWFLNDYEGGWAMQTVGEGPARFFIDGKEITGKWVKNSSKERTQFYDDAGNKIQFNRGQIWINIVPPEIAVSVE